jgi:hypothetical protein
MTDEIRDRLWKEFVDRKEPFAALFAAVLRPVYSWPQGVRRIFVLTWPVSAIVRGVAVVGIGLLAIASGGLSYLRYVGKCRWYGVRSIWE